MALFAVSGFAAIKRFGGAALQFFGATGHLADRFGQRLAHVERDVAADVLGALARQVADLAQDAGTLHRRALLPGAEGALRCGQRTVEVRTAALQARDHRLFFIPNVERQCHAEVALDLGSGFGGSELVAAAEEHGHLGCAEGQQLRLVH